MPLHLTSQVEQIKTEEMGKTQFYASFVNSIVAILSQRLIIQGHYNYTLPDRSKCYKNNRGRFYRNLAIKPSLRSSPSLLRWKFILGERIDKYVRRTISSTEKHRLKATGRFNRKSCRLSHFDLGFNHGTLFGFTRFSSDSSAKDSSI